MSKVGEKVAYLKGLAEGLGVNGETEQGKLMLAMIDTLEALAKNSEEIDERVEELSEYVEEIDSDVSDLEEALFLDDEDEEDDDEAYEDEDDDEDGDGLIEYECPHCGTVIFFDENAFARTAIARSLRTTAKTGTTRNNFPNRYKRADADSAQEAHWPRSPFFNASKARDARRDAG